MQLFTHTKVKFTRIVLPAGSFGQNKPFFFIKLNPLFNYLTKLDIHFLFHIAVDTAKG